jgi:lipopolysaccharide/colanic/teichoic acid biosynthesis glycosyltransferase
VLKRGFDVLAATAGLVVMGPLFLGIAILIRFTSPGPIFFLQKRVGRSFQPFHIIKFRTMIADAERVGGPLTSGTGDARITRVGHLLRRWKLDELPQLINVVRGDMSLVGPRPEVELYVEAFRDDYESILTLRPGITDPASLKFHNESELLQSADEREREYLETILPEKLALSKSYVTQQSLLMDTRIILATLCRIVA